MNVWSEVKRAMEEAWLTSLRDALWALEPLCPMLGVKFLRLDVVSDLRVQAETNDSSGWSLGILDILLKMPGLESSPFKG
jgi:hypothetical protein